MKLHWINFNKCSKSTANRKSVTVGPPSILKNAIFELSELENSGVLLHKYKGKLFYICNEEMQVNNSIFRFGSVH